MRKDYDLKITNLIDDTIKIIPNFSDYYYDDNYELSSNMLFFYTKRYFDNEIPFKVEFNYKSF